MIVDVASTSLSKPIDLHIASSSDDLLKSPSGSTRGGRGSGPGGGVAMGRVIIMSPGFFFGRPVRNRTTVRRQRIGLELPRYGG